MAYHDVGYARHLDRAVLAYIAWPSALAWSVVRVAEPIRWVAIVVSCTGAVGEIWAAISLGASYSPLLSVGKEQVLITAGAYRWIRHPLYVFGLPLMTGWGVAARNWFITATGNTGAVLAMIIRASVGRGDDARRIRGIVSRVYQPN